MPMGLAGYALASFRPHPVSDSSLGTAEMLEPFKKAKLEKKKKDNLFQPSVFPLTSILECGGSFPSKFASRTQWEENLTPGLNAGLYVKYKIALEGRK